MKDEIQARFSIKDFSKMKKPQTKFMIKWLKTIAKELETIDKKAFVNNPRWTLYKISDKNIKQL